MNEFRQLVETIAQTSLPQLLQMAAEESAVPEGGSLGRSPPGVTDALEDAESRRQIAQSPGGISEILRSEDPADAITSVLPSAVI